MAKKRHRGRRRRSNRWKYFNRMELMETYRLNDTLIKKYFPDAGRGYELGLGKDDAHHYWLKSEAEMIVQKDDFRRDFAKVEALRRKQRQRQEDMRSLLLSYGGMEMIEQAKDMSRKVYIHVGLTNSGKTYDALQALKKAESGAYLGPLRLLALEVFDTLNEAGVPCSLLTGEEKIDVPFSNIVASTIDMCVYYKHYDVVVVDEAHLVADRERGSHWTRAILSLDADELHICTAPEGLNIIEGLIKNTGSTCEVVHHKRLTPLEFAGEFTDLKNVEPGDALITFSRREVLRIAAELEAAGVKASVVYGALPPPSRHEEVRKFASGETQVVVATDAIGMGVSLPIRRVIFCKTKKYDGVSTRRLMVSEVKQIAGRAGRFGKYDVGYVLTMDTPEHIEYCLKEETPPVTHLTIPFPQDALSSDYSLQELLDAWQELPPVEGFSREDMWESMVLYEEMKPVPKKATKEEVFSCITCPVDVKSPELVAYWKSCCQAFFRKESMPHPDFIDEAALTLEDCELQYAALDVYSRMLKRSGEKDETMVEKLQLCEKINSLLLETKEGYLKKCKSCGFPLPPNFKFHVCDRCFRRQMRRGGSTDRKLEKNRNRAGNSSGGSGGISDWEMGFKIEWFDPEE
ncbi:MAG: hypothetical protein IKT31_00495 [Firmicutes bacterium]|nr:hypothetical protein [Bacillota bacterium]